MRYLVFADVHGNLPALEKVINEEKNIDGYINLGDVVNYGPWGNECVDLIESLENCINIVGNHEEYYIKRHCNVENKMVQSFFKHTISSFDRFNKIGSYFKSYDFNNFKLVHNIGDHDYVYNDTIISIKDNIILGHSHQQYIRYINNFMLINPGSLGQNRKLIDLASYMLWNTENGEFILKNKSFNVDLLIKQMIINNYPKICIDYYKNKNRVKK
jgi:putative phosphoesterase